MTTTAWRVIQSTKRERKRERKSAEQQPEERKKKRGGGREPKTILTVSSIHKHSIK